MDHKAKQSQPPKTAEIIEPNISNSLEKALQENFAHARHQEIQRERYMALYWILWAAVLAYVGEKGNFASSVADNYYLFGFLSVMSFATLIVNLKWNAEFANHMAAAAAIADKLTLNSSTPEQARTANWPLPYPEFTGYMALPLKFPIYLNVGAWLSVIHCFGFALSICLFSFGPTHSVLGSLFLGLLAGGVALAICYRMYTLMRQGLDIRIPKDSRDLHNRVSV